MSEVDRSLDQKIADVGKGSERANWRRSILARAWDRPATDDASTPCRFAMRLPVRVPSRLMNLSSDFDRRVVLFARNATLPPCSAPGLERRMPGRASRANSLDMQGTDGSITDLERCGIPRAATAGCGGRPISTGEAAAILAEFAIIGTDRAAPDSA